MTKILPVPFFAPQHLGVDYFKIQFWITIYKNNKIKIMKLSD